MNNSNRILGVLAKFYKWNFIIMGVLFSVALFFLGKIFWLVFTSPNEQFRNTFKNLILEKFASDISSMVATVGSFLSLAAIMFLSAALFQLFIRFVQATKAGRSLAEQGAILQKAPKILVSLFVLGCVHQVIATFVSPAFFEKATVPGNPFEAWTVYIDMLTPNTTSSFNLILAILIHIYVKNLLETEALKKEAELVV